MWFYDDSIIQFSAKKKKRISGLYGILAKEVRVTQILFAIKFTGH